MNTPKPSIPTFPQWLLATGVLSDDMLDELYRDYHAGLAPLSTYDTYDTSPRTFTQFVARKYPREFIVYQAMRRLTQ